MGFVIVQKDYSKFFSFQNKIKMKQIIFLIFVISMTDNLQDENFRQKTCESLSDYFYNTKEKGSDLLKNIIYCSF